MDRFCLGRFSIDPFKKVEMLVFFSLNFVYKGHFNNFFTAAFVVNLLTQKRKNKIADLLKLVHVCKNSSKNEK